MKSIRKTGPVVVQMMDTRSIAYSWAAALCCLSLIV